MKTIIKNILTVATITVMSSVMTSCGDDFLDATNPNQPSADTFWQTPEDALMGLTACYDGLQSPYLYRDDVDGEVTGECFGQFMRETSTDNGDHTWGSWMTGSSIVMCTSATTDYSFRCFWNGSYEVIKRCNLLIANIEKCGVDEDVAKRYKAEATVIRSLMYTNLIVKFRDIVYLTEAQTLSNSKAAKTPREEAVKAVMESLKAVAPDLPTVGTEETGHLTREAAYSVLGRIALYNQLWDEAISAYNNVIGKVSLFKAGDGSDYYANFAQLFTEANETHPEILFSVHFKGPGLKEGNVNYSWGMPLNALEASLNLAEDFYCTDGKPWYESSVYDGPAVYSASCTEEEQIKHWSNRDPRFHVTLWTTGDYWPNPDLANNAARSTVHFLKFYVPDNVANEYDGGLDFYIIRYPEVLLSMAEALVEKGASQSEITKYVNEVRARVGMPSVESVEGSSLTQDELRKIVRHERRVELAFEDHRLNDLMRWDDFEGALQRMKDDEKVLGRTYSVQRGNSRGAREKVFPIPQSEIDTNPLLVQHDEWK